MSRAPLSRLRVIALPAEPTAKAGRAMPRLLLIGVSLLVIVLGLTWAPLRSPSTTIYTVSLPEPPDSVALAARQQRVILTTQTPYMGAVTPPDVTLRVLDLRTGAALAVQALGPSGPVLVLAQDAARQRLLLGGSGASLVTLDTRQDVVQRTVVLPWTPIAAVLDPLSGQSMVLGADGTLSLLDMGSGRLLRQQALGQWGAGLALDSLTHTLVVTGRDGEGWVRLLDAASLHPRRTLRLGGAAGAVAVAVRARHVFVLRPNTQAISLLDLHGRLLGTSRVGRTEGVGMLVVDEHTQRVFVANMDDNTVSVLDAHSGRALRTVRVGRRPAALLVDDRAQCVVVVNADDGSLSVLDARSGVVRRTLGIGPHPAAAVDETTGRLVVVSGPDDAPGPSWVSHLIHLAPWLPVQLAPAVSSPGRVRLINLTRYP